MVTSTQPPTEVRDWQFSLSKSESEKRQKGQFRWVTDEGEWMCDKILGEADIIGANGETGRLILRCLMQIQEDASGRTAYCYAYGEPVDTEQYEVNPTPMKFDGVGGMSPQPFEGGESHYRLCYHKQQQNWRLRDETLSKQTGQEELWFVADYRGRIQLDWLDEGTHIFHQGSAEVDTNGIAHFKIGS